MLGTNSSNDMLILCQNVEIDSNEHFSCDIFFRELNRRPRGLETSLRNHQEKCLSCRLNRLNKHSRWDEWQDKVSFCSLIRFNWRVPARVPLFSLGLKVSRSPCGHSGRLSEVMLTHYCRREVRNLIYRYRKIHIDYRSKFSYRFISFISIIYGNTILVTARSSGACCDC